MGERAKYRILVVDDDPAMVSFLGEVLEENGYEVVGAGSGVEALGALEVGDVGLVISDIEMPGMRGLELLKEIHARKPDQLVVLITAFGSMELAVQAVRSGACDFVAKPFQTDTLLHVIERAFQERQMRREIVRLRSRLPREVVVGGLVARSKKMQALMELAGRVADIQSTVLITGESGSGKGALARYIHSLSARNRKAFVQVNCGAIPASLVESELFGVRRGAFTDAKSDRPGLFEQADGGTLFLDEIAEMPMDSQPKLLQVLESGKVRPVGATGELPVDVRLIAATNRSLEEELRERRFRPDLYYRLNVIRLEVPPLRERVEDIPALVDLFVEDACERMNRPLLGVSVEAMRWLTGYSWPGNVRELVNMIERAVALTRHDSIVMDDLQLTPSELPPERDFLDKAVLQELPLEEVEREYIRRVVAACGDNKLEAARILGIDRRTIYRKM